MNDILPNEIIRIIKSFYYGKCDKCNKSKEFYNLKKNITLHKYSSIFDDNYFFNMSNFEYYKFICLDCFDYTYHLSEKNIYYY
jgi:hypothetical protein